MSDNGDTPVTKEQLENAHAEQVATLEADKATHAAAVEAFEEARGRKGFPTEQLIELASAVTKAQADIGLREKLVTKAADNVENFAYIALRDERNALIQVQRDSLVELVSPDADNLRRMGVEEIVLTVSIGAEGRPTVSEKLKGPGVGKVSTPRAPRANGEGSFQSRGSVTVDGVEYSSLNKAYMTLRAEAEGKDLKEITPANSESAMRWLTKEGHTVA